MTFLYMINSLKKTYSKRLQEIWCKKGYLSNIPVSEINSGKTIKLNSYKVIPDIFPSLWCGPVTIGSFLPYTSLICPFSAISTHIKDMGWVPG